jgi:hypothetical protein
MTHCPQLFGTTLAMISGLLIVAFESPAAERRTAVRQDERGIELVHSGRAVLRYHTAVAEPPAGIDAVYRRSGFLHPVATPSGRVVTADFPADHAHQHGIFSAWVKTSFEGRPVDFWNQAGRTGAVEHVRVVETKSDDAGAEFTVELRHSDLTAPGGAKPVLRELWTVTLLARSPQHIFDIESRQTCVADSPLTIHEYHYGGMAFRGCDAWFSADKRRPTDFQFLTSEGLSRPEGNHTRPNWVASAGMVDGAPCGIAVLQHPANFRHPAPARLHDSKPYFVFSPCVLGEFQLEPGVERVWRYRYVVFDGPVDAAAIDSLWQEFAATPAPNTAAN